MNVRQLPVGAELSEKGVDFRVWAPRCRHVEVVLEKDSRGMEQDRRVALAPESDGYFSGQAPNVGAGSRYRFSLDRRPPLYPDPASRFQPDGPHGPSQVVDSRRFPWTDQTWPGVGMPGQVLYEMHIGTFTPDGTWAAAALQLVELAKLGVTLLEIMPIADFPGRFGWGYDGVNFFAPTRLYGQPDDVRRFVDRAHALNLGVILDVVYNHYGPDGNYLPHFSEHYVSDQYKSEWGQAVNFDAQTSGPVREFFLANAAYWIDEFHFDGLRIDATQQIFDRSRDNILAAITRRVREAARGRGTIVLAENEPQQVRLIRPAEQGGFGLDALWNDDFHHTAMVALTAHNEAYYTDYLGNPQELISAVKWGFLYQGQRYSWQKNPRGTPALDVAPAQFVHFLQNHDQVANSGFGRRCHHSTSPGRYRALTALLLLAPQTPMLFQGQEFAASAPFHFFADHHVELTKRVREGRLQFLTQFRNLALPEVQARLPDLAAPPTFEACKLNFAERELHAPMYQLHHDLLQLRRSDPVFGRQARRGVDGAVLAANAFLVRFFAEDGSDDRLLLVNLGHDVRLDPAPEPLLAAPVGHVWRLSWSSEEVCYGGYGTPALEDDGSWRILGESAIVLIPEETDPAQVIVEEKMHA